MNGQTDSTAELGIGALLLVLVILLGVLIVGFLAASRDARPEQEIVVAATRIPKYSVVDRGDIDLTTTRIAESSTQFSSSPDDVLDLISLTDIAPGDPLRPSQLVEQEFLSERAVIALKISEPSETPEAGANATLIVSPRERPHTGHIVSPVGVLATPEGTNDTYTLAVPVHSMQMLADQLGSSDVYLIPMMIWPTSTPDSPMVEAK